MLSEDSGDTIVAEGGSSLVMEHQNTADHYFTEIVGHWNRSVNSILEMGITLGKAHKDLDKDEWETLQQSIEDTNIADKKQQKLLMEMPKSVLLTSYYKDCVSKGNKPSLPCDWKSLYQITTLDKSTFDRGVLNGIICNTTSVGDVSKLKSGTHPNLPGYKKPEPKDKLEGKIVASVAVDFTKIETKDQAEELEDAIQKAINKVSQLGFVDGKLTDSIVGKYADEEEKRSKGKLSAIERTQKQMKSLSDKLSKLDAKTRQGINPSYTKTLQKFMSAA